MRQQVVMMSSCCFLPRQKHGMKGILLELYHTSIDQFLHALAGFGQDSPLECRKRACKVKMSTPPPLPARVVPFHRDTEIALAALRTAFLVLLVLSPQFLYAQGMSGLMLVVTTIAAAGYNLILFVLHMDRRFFPRWGIVTIDTLLITLWVYFSGPGNDRYFIFYFAIVIVAGLWFRRLGVIATVLSISALYVWAINYAPMPEEFARTAVWIVGFQVLVLALTAGVVSVAAAVYQQEREALIYAKVLMPRVEMAKHVDRLLRPPTLPPTPGLDLGLQFRPAGHGVSGDYYDVIPLGDRRWGFVVGDARSKEEQALAYLPIFKSSLRLHARADRSPAAVLTQINREVAADMSERNDREGFISMCYAVIDLDQGTLTYANAGMEAGLLVSSHTGHLLSFTSRGLVLGVEPEAAYEEETWALHTGDTLALFSDGLTEAFDKQGVMLGHERLVAKLASAMTEHSAEAVARETFQFVLTYSEGARRRDDSTLLVVRITASEVGPFPEPSAV